MRQQGQTGAPGDGSILAVTSPGQRVESPLFREHQPPQLRIAYQSVGSEAQTQAALARALAILFGGTSDGLDAPGALPAASAATDGFAPAGERGKRHDRALSQP
jgi:hypothetical protein